MTEKMNEKEKAEMNENLRELAKYNLSSKGLMGMATTHLVDSSGQYGEAGNSAVEQFTYMPAFDSGAYTKDPETGKEVNVIQNAIMASRQEGGKRYSGNVSEYKIMEQCAGIMQNSLANLKVQDVLEMSGSKEKVSEKYKNKYVKELDKKEAEQIMGIYMTQLTDNTVAYSLNERSKQYSKGLEGIVSGSKKE